MQFYGFIFAMQQEKIEALIESANRADPGTADAAVCLIAQALQRKAPARASNA